MSNETLTPKEHEALTIWLEMLAPDPEVDYPPDPRDAQAITTQAASKFNAIINAAILQERVDADPGAFVGALALPAEIVEAEEGVPKTYGDIRLEMLA